MNTAVHEKSNQEELIFAALKIVEGRVFMDGDGNWRVAPMDIRAMMSPPIASGSSYETLVAWADATVKLGRKI